MPSLPALHLKALRDLCQMRGQALAIALVVASGIAMLVMAQSTLLSLENTRTRMYEQFAFSDIWASIKRAPEGVAARVVELPGVASIETRIQMGAKLSLPGYDGPISSLLQSLPDDGSQP
ncbi:MAG: ABC transporter permease, partial [Lautropia sp.]|nr:ABC transporter permease [Lautropia sp.]